MAKKKYSINWENGEAVSFEINGTRYKSLDEINDPKDLQKMMAILGAAEDDEELGVVTATVKPGNSSFPIEKIIPNVFAGIGALMLLIAVISAGSAFSTIFKEKNAPGRVVDVVVRRQYVNQQDRIIEEYYYPVVDFKAEDGRRRSVQMSVGSNPPEFEKGDNVTVLYDPEKPLDARIKSFGSSAVMWILPGITGILGIVFLGAVLLVRRVLGSEVESKSI